MCPAAVISDKKPACMAHHHGDLAEMSYIGDVARNALTTAHSDLAKARRTLLLVAGLLALIHLLTVHPYLRVSREMAAIEPRIAADDALLARLKPEIDRLSTAGQEANQQIKRVLQRATNRMMADFAELRTLVEKARSGERPVPLPPPMPGHAPSAMAGQIAQQAPLQTMPVSPVQPVPGPVSSAMAAQLLQQGPFQTMPVLPPNLPGLVRDADLEGVLAALASGAPDAYERLTRYARESIVGTAYASAHREWTTNVRSAYLQVLDQVEHILRVLAKEATNAVSQEAQALSSAAEELAQTRATIEAIEIRPDHRVNEALGTDWWRTVSGKEQYADAVGVSIDNQMQSIAEASVAPAAAINSIRERQQALHSALSSRRAVLETQFAAQTKELATLSGASGVLPIDLKTFIGVFPLVLGVVLALLLLRIGQARHDAARATEELATAAPEDRETRQWLARRALGGDQSTGPVILTAFLAAGACLWIILAAIQLIASLVDPPVATPVACAAGIALVLAAAGWDLRAIRQLDRAKRL